MLQWFKDKWNWFESKVYKIMPGLKTTTVTALGFVGSTAAVAQQYITNLPLEKFATATQIAVVTMVISILALWFHNMGDRVAENN